MTFAYVFGILFKEHGVLLHFNCQGLYNHSGPQAKPRGPEYRREDIKEREPDLNAILKKNSEKGTGIGKLYSRDKEQTDLSRSTMFMKESRG